MVERRQGSGTPRLLLWAAATLAGGLAILTPWGLWLLPLFLAVQTVFLVLLLRGGRTAASDGEHPAATSIGETDLLFRTAQVLILVLDGEARIELLNPFGEEITGHRLAEVKGRRWDEVFLPEEEHATFRQRFESLLEGEVSAGHMRTVLTREGERRRFRFASRRIQSEEGRLQGVLAVGVDVTASERAQLELERSEERFRTVVQESRDGIFVVKEGRIVLANAALKRNFPFPSESGGGPLEALPALLDMVMDHERERVQELLAAALEDTAEPVRINFTARVPGGGDQEAELELASIRWEGTPAVLGVVRGTGGREKAEEERRAYLQARLEAERKQVEAMKLAEQSARLASIGVIAGGITHEINQPLNAIRLGTDGILLWQKQNPGVIPEIFAELVQDISDGAHRISEIVEHMRSYWVTPAAEELALVELNESVRSALALTSRQAQNHQIRLAVELEAEPLHVRADPIQLEQVVNNLVTNAIRAHDQAEREQRSVLVATHREGSRAVLEITDNAFGLKAEEEGADRVFDPFYSSRGSEDGGLGLAIVKTFVERFHGEVTACNNDRGGATFAVSFALDGNGGQADEEA